MRILFMGTPDIAAVALRAMIKENMEIVGVVTQPDKPRGRKQILTPPEAKEAAMEAGIPVFQPEKVKNGELMPVLEELKPDLIAVVAYGKILPDHILDYPKYGCVNMHGSILPEYRGAAPIQWSVIDGKKVTGVTTQKMAQGVDTGDILMTETIEIGEYETSGELFDRMAVLGAKVLIETINNIENITPVPQEHEKATHAPMITKEMAQIDWNKSAGVISKLICGMNPWPIAHTLYNGEVMKVYKAKVVEGNPQAENGEILGFDKACGLKVKCAEGCLAIEEIQFPGSKRMSVEDYLRGHSLDSGVILGR